MNEYKYSPLNYKPFIFSLSPEAGGSYDPNLPQRKLRSSYLVTLGV